MKANKSKTNNELNNIFTALPAEMFDKSFVKLTQTYEQMINLKQKQLNLYQRFAVDSEEKIKLISAKVNKISQNLKETNPSLLPSEKEKLILVLPSHLDFRITIIHYWTTKALMIHYKST